MCCSPQACASQSGHVLLMTGLAATRAPEASQRLPGKSEFSVWRKGDCGAECELMVIAGWARSMQTRSASKPREPRNQYKGGVQSASVSLHLCSRPAVMLRSLVRGLVQLTDVCPEFIVQFWSWYGNVAHISA